LTLQAASRPIAERHRRCDKHILAVVKAAPMKLLLQLFALLMLCACAAQVSHPSKSTAEMEADIKLCTDRANHKYWMDPVAALYNAYDCLEAKGYERGHTGLAAKVERALGEKPPTSTPAARPCAVPCRKPGG
jgi:hypothetical protein